MRAHCARGHASALRTSAPPTCLLNCCVSAIARADMSAAFAVLERFVNAREPRHMVQALRVLGPFRKKGKESPGVAVGALMAALSTHVAPSAALRAPMLALLGMLPQPAEPVPAPAASEDKDDEKKASISKLPENEVLVGLLVLTLLLDHNQVIAAVPFSLQLMERVGALKRRTLDPIAERVYFYASWAHEVNGTLVAIRSPLLAAHRTACLHHNSTCQATLLNLLLRNYQVRLPPRPHHPPGRASSVGVSPPMIGPTPSSPLIPRPPRPPLTSLYPRPLAPSAIAPQHYKLFDQAEKLLTKTTFPESAGATQLARYLYYTGRIKALQLEYTEAHRCLLQAQRKAPTTKGLGSGWRCTSSVRSSSCCSARSPSAPSSATLRAARRCAHTSSLCRRCGWATSPPSAWRWRSTRRPSPRTATTPSSCACVRT